MTSRVFIQAMKLKFAMHTQDEEVKPEVDPGAREDKMVLEAIRLAHGRQLERARQISEAVRRCRTCPPLPRTIGQRKCSLPRLPPPSSALPLPPPPLHARSATALPFPPHGPPSLLCLSLALLSLSLSPSGLSVRARACVHVHRACACVRFLCDAVAAEGGRCAVTGI